MPAKERKNKKGGYTVTTPGGVKSKNTTKTKADALQAGLRAIQRELTARAKGG